MGQVRRLAHGSKDLMHHLEAQILLEHHEKLVLNNYLGGLDYQYSNYGIKSEPNAPSDLYELWIDGRFYNELCFRIEIWKTRFGRVTRVRP